MDSNLSELQLIKVAEKARIIFEQSKTKTQDFCFRFFPNGTCGVVSELLARFLNEKFDANALYVWGEKDDGKTHAWVVVNNFIIDITADQFGEAAVIVKTKSDWP